MNTSENLVIIDSELDQQLNDWARKDWMHAPQPNTSDKKKDEEQTRLFKDESEKLDAEKIALNDSLVENHNAWLEQDSDQPEPFKDFDAWHDDWKKRTLDRRLNDWAWKNWMLGPQEDRNKRKPNQRLTDLAWESWMNKQQLDIAKESSELLSAQAERFNNSLADNYNAWMKQRSDQPEPFRDFDSWYEDWKRRTLDERVDRYCQDRRQIIKDSDSIEIDEETARLALLSIHRRYLEIEIAERYNAWSKYLLGGEEPPSAFDDAITAWGTKHPLSIALQDQLQKNKNRIDGFKRNLPHLQEQLMKETIKQQMLQKKWYEQNHQLDDDLDQVLSKLLEEVLNQYRTNHQGSHLRSETIEQDLEETILLELQQKEEMLKAKEIEKKKKDSTYKERSDKDIQQDALRKCQQISEDACSDLEHEIKKMERAISEEMRKQLTLERPTLTTQEAWSKQMQLEQRAQETANTPLLRNIERYKAQLKRPRTDVIYIINLRVPSPDMETVARYLNYLTHQGQALLNYSRLLQKEELQLNKNRIWMIESHLQKLNQLHSKESPLSPNDLTMLTKEVGEWLSSMAEWQSKWEHECRKLRVVIKSIQDKCDHVTRRHHEGVLFTRLWDTNRVATDIEGLKSTVGAMEQVLASEVRDLRVMERLLAQVPGARKANASTDGWQAFNDLRVRIKGDRESMQAKVAVHIEVELKQRKESLAAADKPASWVSHWMPHWMQNLVKKVAPSIAKSPSNEALQRIYPQVASQIRAQREGESLSNEEQTVIQINVRERFRLTLERQYDAICKLEAFLERMQSEFQKPGTESEYEYLSSDEDRLKRNLEALADSELQKTRMTAEEIALPKARIEVEINALNAAIQRQSEQLEERFEALNSRSDVNKDENTVTRLLEARNNLIAQIVKRECAREGVAENQYQSNTSSKTSGTQIGRPIYATSNSTIYLEYVIPEQPTVGIMGRQPSGSTFQLFDMNFPENSKDATKGHSTSSAVGKSKSQQRNLTNSHYDKPQKYKPGVIPIDPNGRLTQHIPPLERNASKNTSQKR